MPAELASPPVVFAVGIDTARYGHHVTILRSDRGHASQPFIVQEHAAGYELLRQHLERLAQRHPGAEFHVHVDAAGQYAVNLERFLRALPWPMLISVGEPKRNKNYREAIFPKGKSDCLESHAMSRFALAEGPRPAPELPPAFFPLREAASRLESQSRQTTRAVNGLHNLLSRVFPELAMLQQDLSAAWVLELLTKYPTARQIAAARLPSLKKIPYLQAEKAEALHAAAQTSIGALQDDLTGALVRHAAEQVLAGKQAEKRLKQLLQAAYDALPDGNHRQVGTIPGIGPLTTAALVAKIVDIDRFATPSQLANYFGVFPETHGSGVDRQGRPLPPASIRMSTKGNDLVRGCLWMAAQSAIQHNPAVTALYARHCARGKSGHKAFGACMRKLLDLTFAVWKSGKAFDPAHYPWERPAAKEPQATVEAPAAATTEVSAAPPASENEKAAAGRKRKLPQRTAVTAAEVTIDAPPSSVNAATPSRPASRSADFPWLRGQVTMEQVLRKLGVWEQLRGHDQRRGPCPIHDGDNPAGKTFSVNVSQGVFRCFHPACAAQGNVLDLWAAVHRLSPHEAALHLAETFHIPLKPTEKRNP